MRVRASWDDLTAAAHAVSSDAAIGVTSLSAPPPPPAVMPAAPSAAAPSDAVFFQATPAPSSTRSYASITNTEAAELPFLKSTRGPAKSRMLLFAGLGAIACAGLWAAFSGGSASEPSSTAAAPLAAPAVDSAPLTATETAPGTAFVNSRPASLPQAGRPAPAAQVSSPSARGNHDKLVEPRLKDSRREGRELRAKENESRRRRASVQEPAAKPTRPSAEPVRKRPIAETKPIVQRPEPAKVSEPAKRKGTGFVSTNPY